MELTEARKKLIVALDGDYGMRQIADIVSLLRDEAGMVKIGMRLFTRLGPEAVETAVKAGMPVFLDLKFHDIPHTVQQACEEAVRLGVAMMTVHGLGGPTMLRKAVEGLTTAAQSCNNRKPKLLAVTVLTSMDADELRAIGFEHEPSELVRRLAVMASEQGIDGIVASPREIELAREAMGDGFLIVTPGIRPSGVGGPADDQKRTLSPGAAITAGADYIVVGRPIIAAPDPIEAARAIVRDMAEG